MKVLIEFVKNTVIGGLIFLLPFGIIVFVLTELFDLLDGVSAFLGGLFFPNSEWPFLTSLISALILLAAAFFAGLLARSGFAGGFAAGLDRLVAQKVPGYAMIRQTIVEVSGSHGEIENAEKLRIVTVQQGNMTRFGIAVGQVSESETIVYLPGAPSVFKGFVAIVPSAQVTDTDIKPARLAEAMQQLGRGIDKLYEAEK